MLRDEWGLNDEVWGNVSLLLMTSCSVDSRIVVEIMSLCL